MSVFTHLRYWIWDSERGLHFIESGLQLQASTGSFPSPPSHSIATLPDMTDFLVWGHGKKAQISRLHCTCRAVHASSWSGKSNSKGGQVFRSELYGGGRAWGGHSQYRDYVETLWILVEHGARRVRHQLPACWNRWAFYIVCGHARVLLVRRHIISKYVLGTLATKSDMPL